MNLLLLLSSFFLFRGYAVNASKVAKTQKKLKAAIIVPIMSRAVDGSQIYDLPFFKFLVPGLMRTLPETLISAKPSSLTSKESNNSVYNSIEEEQQQITVSMYLGYDAGDPVFDDGNKMASVEESVSLYLPSVQFRGVRLEGLTGKVVHIWNALAEIAFAEGADYYFMLGDDVVLKTPNWIRKIVNVLQSTTEENLISNFGTVSFFDEAYSNFPTFPVFHKTHLEIFGANQAFNTFFTNTFADPVSLLFDVYAIFNSSKILRDIRLENIIGGNPEKVLCTTKFTSCFTNIEDYIDLVHRGRRQVAKWISNQVTSGRITVSRRLGEFWWSPKSLSFGHESFFYETYCTDF